MERRIRFGNGEIFLRRKHFGTQRAQMVVGTLGGNVARAHRAARVNDENPRSRNAHRIVAIRI